MTPSFYYIFNISLYCNDTLPSFIDNLWRVLLLGNHLKKQGGPKQKEEIKFQFGDHEVSCNSLLPTTPAIAHPPPTLKPFSGCEAIHLWMEKSFCFSIKRLRSNCCMPIFFHVKMKYPRLDQTQIRFWNSFFLMPWACSSRRHMWVEFVVGSHFCSERFFPEYSGFPLSLKTNIFNFQFDPGMHGHL